MIAIVSAQAALPRHTAAVTVLVNAAKSLGYVIAPAAGTLAFDLFPGRHSLGVALPGGLFALLLPAIAARTHTPNSVPTTPRR